MEASRELFDDNTDIIDFRHQFVNMANVSVTYDSDEHVSLPWLIDIRCFLTENPNMVVGFHPSVDLEKDPD